MRKSGGGVRGELVSGVVWCLLVLAAAARAQAPDAIGEFTAANGLKAVHSRAAGNEVVAVRVYFKGGVRNITAKNAGIETLLLEVAQNGTKNFTKSQLNRELARMGTIIDSAGGYDYSVIAMQCVRPHFERSWELLADMVLNPTFDEKEVALNREQMVNLLRQEADDPDSYVSTLSNRLLYAAHPYINRPVGTVESVGALTAADLRAHYAGLLQTSRMLVVMVGDIPLPDFRRKVEVSFGKLPRGDYRPEPLPRFAEAGKPAFELDARPVPTNYIRGVFAAPSPGDPDYAAAMVAIEILKSQFFEEVRVKRNLSYAPEAAISAAGANSGSISVSTPRPNDAIRVMFEEIDRLQSNVLRAEPLADLVSFFLTSFYLKLETNDAQAARLGEYELLGGGWRRALTWMDDVRKVTPEDIQRVARTYLKNFHFAVIGEKEKFDRALFTSR